jgi:hypothetical protein
MTPEMTFEMTPEMTHEMTFETTFESTNGTMAGKKFERNFEAKFEKKFEAEIVNWAETTLATTDIKVGFKIFCSAANIFFKLIVMNSLIFLKI